ncbi:MAG: aminotransferase class IV [Bacteroidota bacterium]
MDTFIIYNGEIKAKEKFSLDLSNRGFRFGDSIFETIRVFEGKIVFIEDHIKRLFTTLDIVRMNLPEYFTSEYLQKKIIDLIKLHDSKNLNARIRLTVFRKESKEIYFVDKGEYADFIIEYFPIESSNFIINKDKGYEISTYEKIKKASGLLSQIKSNNVLLHSIAGSVAREKLLDNIILVNESDNLTEAVNANIFIGTDNIISTPKLEDGCVDGILRKKLMELIRERSPYSIIEREIHKDELLQCDEVFLTNSIMGIQPVHKCKDKTYETEVSEKLSEIIINEINLMLDQQES